MKNLNCTPTPEQVTRAATNIRGRTTEQVIRDAATGLTETDPTTFGALVLALVARYDAKLARRAGRATV